MFENSIRWLLVSVFSLILLLNVILWYSSHLERSSLESAEMGERAVALHKAEAAVRYNPFSVSARFVLAGAQRRLGREVAARNSLQKAIDMQPDNYLTWTQMALYERDYWNEPESARNHFGKAYTLNPQDLMLNEVLKLNE